MMYRQRKEEPINIDEIAKIAGCSFGFFQKVFSYMNGISFSEYIRYRKLTLAGYDLKTVFISIFLNFSTNDVSSVAKKPLSLPN